MLFIIALLVITILANGQDIPKRKYKAERIEKAPVINGDLNDDAWRGGEWEGGFIQSEPYEGRIPSQPTEFKVRFDNLNLYIAIKAYDSAPDSINNRMSRRDNGDGDMVFLIFDSYHDLRTGFTFGVSSAGVRFDMIFSNDGRTEDPTWDPIWQAKAKIHDWGWVAEMKIPFTQLRFKKNSSDVWGFDVVRQIFRHNEMSMWQIIPRTASGLIHLMGEIDGLQGVEPRKQLDLMPYAVASYNTYEPEDGNPFATGKDPHLSGGLDAKIGVTNNLTLDLTINPDFGQVEADPSEVNLSAFETYFEEKRPFFIEGNNITSFNVGLGDGDVGNDNLFYSRRIGRRPHGYPSLADGEYADVPVFTNILGAAKLTGKTEGGLSMGFLQSVTAEMHATIDSSGKRRKGMVEPLTSYSIARMQKDFNKGHTIFGGSVTNVARRLDGTNLDYLHKNALTGGLDFTQYFKDKNYVINSAIFFSNVKGTEDAITRTQRASARYFQRPDADYLKYDESRTSLSGIGGKLEMGKVGGKWNFLFMNIWKSPGVEINDLGYMREANTILNVLWTGYNFIEPFSIFRSLRLNNDVYTVYDFGGNLNGLGYEANVNADFKNLWNGGIGFGYNAKQVSNSVLRGGPSMKLPDSWRFNYRLSTDDRKKLSFSFHGNHNKGAEDYMKSNSYNFGISFRPTNTLKISVNPGYSTNHSDLQYLSAMDLNNETRYMFAKIDQKIFNMSLRINFNITPDLTIQYWGQPFIGTFNFSEFKIIKDPKAGNFSDRYHVYTPDEISLVGDTYFVDNGDYNFDFSNPDFTNNEWLSNLVVRWEFLPGSTAFLVWSQSRYYYGDSETFDFGENLNNLYTDQKANNIFLVKFSYRFGLN